VSITSDGTFMLCDGSYAVNLDVEANVDFMSANGAATTTLDGSDAGTVVAVGDGYDVTITDLTITAGNGDEGVFIAASMGGGVYVGTGSSATVAGSVLSDNYGYAGGSFIVEGGTLTVTDTQLDANQAAFGGDILIWDGSAGFDGVASTDAYASTSGGSIYVGGYTAAGSMTLDDSTVDSATSGYANIYIDGGYGFSTDLDVTASAVTNGEIADSDYAAVYISGSDGTIVSFGSDWGTSGGGDDNDPTDVRTDGGSDTYAYGDGAFFTCTSDGCEDSVVYDGVTGSITHLSSGGFVASTGSYVCSLEFAVAGTGTADICDGCDFGFDATWTLDTTTAVTTSCSYPSSDTTYDLAFASTPTYYTDSVLYYSPYEGYFVPWLYATRTGNSISASAGYYEYSYYSSYYGTTYYYTNYQRVDLEVY
jgi:hypothetical protein